MKPTYKGDHETCELRVSKVDRQCFTWQERGGAEEPQCTRMIGEGETYMVSTIFPGHDSGYADGGHRPVITWHQGEIVWDRVAVPPSPVSSVFCLPCCDRWNGLRDALAFITAERDRVAS